jgi:hypothetical protein
VKVLPYVSSASLPRAEKTPYQQRNCGSGSRQCRDAVSEKNKYGAIVTLSGVSGREIDFAAGPCVSLKAALIHEERSGWSQFSALRPVLDRWQSYRHMLKVILPGFHATTNNAALIEEILTFSTL